MRSGEEEEHVGMGGALRLEVGVAIQVLRSDPCLRSKAVFRRGVTRAGLRSSEPCRVVVQCLSPGLKLAQVSTKTGRLKDRAYRHASPSCLDLESLT